MRVTRWLTATAWVVGVATSAPAWGEPQAPGKPPAATAQPQAEEGYTYRSAGRRDPFVSLLNAGNDLRPTLPGKRQEGLAGMLTADIAVRGVVDSRGTLIAMIQGPDNKTYLVHPGDKLLDGTIKSITRQGLIVDQQVNDALSVQKRRDVSKLLRSAQAAKESQ